MESKKKREPKAYLIENGVRMPLVVPKPKKLSALGKWMREHPGGVIEILDMRAAMK